MSHISQKDLLIIFAKSPRAVHVKTRLAQLFSKKQRAQLQEAFILETLLLTASIHTVARVIACTPDTKDRFFAACEREHSISLIAQEGDDLGDRMKRGFCWGFLKGFQRVVIIGSDAPTLPASFIQEAFNQLKTIPIVLGPALDGGYYLIGARMPLPDIFTNIKWGTNTVFKDTVARLKQFYLLPFWYDVDYPEDVTFLQKHIDLIAKRRLRV
jgi:hypothetical protein